MVSKLEKLRAFDLERKVICPVMSIVLSELNDREFGRVELNNGHVTFWKNFIKKECILLEFTEYQDVEKQDIYDGDILESDSTIYVVEWNRNQSCWWLSPIHSKINEAEMIFSISNQMLGNGYYARRDLTKIGNKHTHPHLM